MKIEIPSFLKHLPIEERGYPIPFFVPKIDGKYEFRFVDEPKRKDAFQRKLCGICGKKLLKRDYWFIGGILTFTNGYSTDIHMHNLCAAYALRVCPYLFNQKADRVVTTPLNKEERVLVTEKPEKVYLIFSEKCEWITGSQHHPLFKFKPRFAHEYDYVDKVLVDTGKKIYTKNLIVK